MSTISQHTLQNAEECKKSANKQQHIENVAKDKQISYKHLYDRKRNALYLLNSQLNTTPFEKQNIDE